MSMENAHSLLFHFFNSLYSNDCIYSMLICIIVVFDWFSVVANRDDYRRDIFVGVLITLRSSGVRIMDIAFILKLVLLLFFALIYR